jgi:hypothetical protein
MQASAVTGCSPQVLSCLVLPRHSAVTCFMQQALTQEDWCIFSIHSWILHSYIPLYPIFWPGQLPTTSSSVIFCCLGIKSDRWEGLTEPFMHRSQPLSGLPHHPLHSCAFLIFLSFIGTSRGFGCRSPTPPWRPEGDFTQPLVLGALVGKKLCPSSSLTSLRTV